MWVIKTDQTGQPVLDAAGKPVMIEIPDAFGEQNGAQKFLTTDEAEARVRDAAKKAAADEKRKVQKELDEANAARGDLESRMAASEKANKERERAALPPDQQVMSRMNEMEQELARTRAFATEVQAKATRDVRQIGLLAYRERAVRDVPEEVRHLVFGQTEEEIDNSVDQAINTYNELNQKLEAKFAAARGMSGEIALQQAPQYAPQQQYAPQAYQPPFNPAYVQPVHPGYAAQAGFPTATNPPQMPDAAGDDQADISAMTTEQAVRSGRYGGEMRERIHQSLKGQAKYPGALGSAPRHWNAAPPLGHAPMPGGVMQPQGTPMGPVQHPGMQAPQYAPPQYQQPAQPQVQYVPQVQSPQQGARSQAAEAVARMHAGGNAIANGDTATNGALQQGHQFLQQRGIPSPQAALAQRFTPTPPITQ